MKASLIPVTYLMAVSYQDARGINAQPVFPCKLSDKESVRSQFNYRYKLSEVGTTVTILAEEPTGYQRVVYAKTKRTFLGKVKHLISELTPSCLRLLAVR